MEYNPNIIWLSYKKYLYNHNNVNRYNFFFFTKSFNYIDKMRREIREKSIYKYVIAQEMGMCGRE